MSMHRSLLRNLLAWTLGALLVVWAAFMYFGYETGVHEAGELTDGHLASVASLLASQQPADVTTTPGPSPALDLGQLKAHDYQQSLSTVVWDAAGNLLARTGQAPLPPFTRSDAFETLMLGDPPVPWRAFSHWSEGAQDRKIMVLLSEVDRDALAADIAGQIAEPGLWLVPVVAIVLVLAIRRGLQPLFDLSDQVNRLDVHHDSQLKAPPHIEFKAIEQSVNMLIDRYNTALAHERELASEVAHELRTPLASLRLHAASLQLDLSSEEFADARQRVEADAARASAVLTDLLALARASRIELAQAREPVDLAGLARRVAADYGQAALDAGRELSVDAPAACTVMGHPVLIEQALRNLIENALAHGGSTVRVAVSGAPAVLEVVDNGAPADARDASESPRWGLGLGLGHQVVRRVAEVHDGHFETRELRHRGERSYRIVFAPGTA